MRMTFDLLRLARCRAACASDAAIGKSANDNDADDLLLHLMLMSPGA